MHTKHHAAGRYGHTGYGHFRTGPGANWRRPRYNVPLNVVDTATGYEVHVYALGFAKENISLAVVDDVLYISGTRPVDENNPPVFSYQEYPVKSFERMLSLRGQVDTARIRARQEDGVLIVTLPKTPEAQRPAQEIKVE